MVVFQRGFPPNESAAFGIGGNPVKEQSAVNEEKAKFDHVER